MYAIKCGSSDAKAKKDANQQDGKTKTPKTHAEQHDIDHATQKKTVATTALEETTGNRWVELMSESLSLYSIDEPCTTAAVGEAECGDVCVGVSWVNQPQTHREKGPNQQHATPERPLPLPPPTVALYEDKPRKTKLWFSSNARPTRVPSTSAQ